MDLSNIKNFKSYKILLNANGRMFFLEKLMTHLHSYNKVPSMCQAHF